MSWTKLDAGHENEALYMGLEVGDQVAAVKTSRTHHRKSLHDPQKWEGSMHVDVFEVALVTRDHLLGRAYGKRGKSAVLRDIPWTNVLGFRKPVSVPSNQTKT